MQPLYGFHISTTTSFSRLINDPAECALNSTAWFDSWKAGYCFATGNTSFMVTESVLYSYNGTGCDAASRSGRANLTSYCESVDNSEGAAPEDLFTGLRVTYATYGKSSGLCMQWRM